MKKFIFIFTLFICGVSQSQIIYLDNTILNKTDTIKNALIKVNADNTGFIKMGKDTCVFDKGNFKDVDFLSKFSKMQPINTSTEIKNNDLIININMSDINYSFKAKITKIITNGERPIFRDWITNSCERIK